MFFRRCPSRNVTEFLNPSGALSGISFWKTPKLLSGNPEEAPTGYPPGVLPQNPSKESSDKSLEVPSGNPPGAPLEKFSVIHEIV